MIPLYVLACTFGALIGSFLNVVIYRHPRGIPLGMERSKCPQCGVQIVWFDNIPLLSWLVLRGRCRACHGSIAMRYPAVELLTALLFGICLERTLALAWTPLPAGFLVSAAATSVLIAIAFIDLDLRVLPDTLTLRALMPIGILGAVLVPNLHGTSMFGVELAGGSKPGLASLLVGVAGAGLGAGILAAIRALGARIAPARKKSSEQSAPQEGGETQSPPGERDYARETMGRGEIKLMASAGLLLGPEGALFAIGTGMIVGAVVGGGLSVFARGKRGTPFGAFLSVGIVTALLYQAELMRLVRAVLGL